jgi:zeaxanthin glucosyltransferase
MSGRILFGLLPAWGHVAPTVALAQELQARGHQVAYACHPSVGPALRRAGLDLRGEFQWGDRVVQSMAHRRRGGSRLTWFLFIARGRLMTVFTHDLGRGVDDLRRLIRTWKPDVLVSDLLFSPGPIAAELEDVPCATSCPNVIPHWDEDDLPPYGSGLPYDAPRDLRWRVILSVGRSVRARMDRVINRVRRANGLPDAAHPFMGFSPYLGLAYVTEAVEYPRRHLGRQVHYIGPSLSETRGDHGVEFPWEWLDGRTLVLLSFGSIYLDHDRFYREAAEASRGQPWQIVIRVGPGFDRERAGRPAGNVLFVDDQPQIELLRRTSVMITHAGMNSCLEALTRGVPLLLATVTGEQADLAERIIRAGAGLRIDMRRSRAGEIRDAVHRLLELDEASFREGAERIARDFARCDGPTTGADLVERLMHTRNPVLRPGGVGPTVYRQDRHAHGRMRSS